MDELTQIAEQQQMKTPSRAELGVGRAEALGDDDDLRASLTALSRLTSSSMSLERVLTHVAEFAVGAIPGADGAGLRVRGEGGPATVVVTADFVCDIDAVESTVEEGPAMSAVASGRVVRSGSLGGDPQWPRFGPRVGRMGVHSVVSVPLLMGDDGVIGVMTFYARAKEAFEDRAVELGELFAVPAAVTVGNARALAAARTMVAQLEHALSGRSVVDQAIGIMMTRSEVTPEDGLGRLRQISQRENTKLVVVAQRMVDATMRKACARNH